MLTSFVKQSKKYPVALMLLSVLFLGSCSPMKKMISTRQSLERNSDQKLTMDQTIWMDSTANQTKTTSNQIARNSTTQSEQSANQELLTIVREYDTDKPLDEKTGMPPIKKETIQTRRKADAGRTKTTEEQTTHQRETEAKQNQEQQIVQTVLQKQTKDQSHIDQQADMNEKRGLNTWQQILCSLGVLLVAGVIFWIGYKLRKRFFNP